FETFNDAAHRDRLMNSLDQGRSAKALDVNASFFEIKPYPFQLEILEKLEVERAVHLRCRNLVVAATGTGKTVISAFDYKAFRKKNQSAKLLFLAHRKEILVQAVKVFREVL